MGQQEVTLEPPCTVSWSRQVQAGSYPTCAVSRSSLLFMKTWSRGRPGPCGEGSTGLELHTARGGGEGGGERTVGRGSVLGRSKLRGVLGQQTAAQHRSSSKAPGPRPDSQPLGRLSRYSNGQAPPLPRNLPGPVPCPPRVPPPHMDGAVHAVRHRTPPRTFQAVSWLLTLCHHASTWFRTVTGTAPLHAIAAARHENSQPWVAINTLCALREHVG